ncbi:MAG TPA: hypothetical protein VL443_29930 [Cyclobacteriaceae bacterium]|nr:hypothetical protein [Cyclobacteriaceae bacterium]
MEIIETEDVKKIAIGEADEKTCAEEWEKLVRKNYETNGGFDYFNYVDLSKSYANILAESNIVKASILKLIALNLEVGICFVEPDEIFIVDNDLIDDLRNRGYKIDTTNKIKYRQSIEAALKKAENFVTRLKMKANEINEMMKDKGEAKRASFEEIMANLSFILGFPVPDDITLCRFNEYKKIIDQKNKQSA